MKDQEQTVELKEIEVVAKKPETKPAVTQTHDGPSYSYEKEGKTYSIKPEQLQEHFKDEYEKISDEKVRDQYLKNRYKLMYSNSSTSTKVNPNAPKNMIKDFFENRKKSAWEE